MKKLLIFIFCLVSKLMSSQSWQPVGAGFLPNGVDAFFIYSNELYAGGGIATSASITLNGVSKWNGFFWDSLASGGFFGNPHCFVNFNSHLIAGGNFQKMNGYPNTLGIAAWDGINWNALGLGIGGTIKTMAVFNGYLYVGGNISKVNGNVLYDDLAWWDGTTWHTIPTSQGLSVIESMAVYNGELYVGGYFSSIDSVPVQNIAKFNGTAWSAVGGGLSSDVVGLFTDTVNNRLYACGSFLYANNLSIPCPAGVAYWDGISWNPVGSVNPIFNAKTIQIYHNQLYVGFNALVCPANQTGDTLKQIARWNGNDWVPVGGGLDGSALAMAVYDDKLVVGGGFTTAGGIVVNHVAFWSDTTTGIAPVKNAEQKLIITPNPAKNTLEITAPFAVSSYTLTSQTGQKVKQKKVKPSTVITLYIATLPKGVYAVTLSNGNKEITKQFVKE